MKIGIDEVKQIPSEVSNNVFGVCVYGEPSARVSAWIDEHCFVTEKVGPYTNILVDKDISEVFVDDAPTFDYLDGFSPNLNKHLHIGHASNLVLAKAFQALGAANDTVAILGDTLTGEVSKEEALIMFNDYCTRFNYKVTHKIFFASEMKLDETDSPLFVDGYDDPNDKVSKVGTKVFVIDGKQYVGIKSDGTTSYFYQDVAFGQALGRDSRNLIMTGSEQGPHFAVLKLLFPKMHHIALGLVKANGVKMASRKGNVIMFEEVLAMLMEQFGGDEKLCYNVLAGFILRSAPKSDKNIDLDTLSNPLNSPGLYLSYTLAKLKSAGVIDTWLDDKKDSFMSWDLQFAELKARKTLHPNVLFEALVNHAKGISTMYQTHRIKDNEDNRMRFGFLLHDLLHGMKRLGMFDIDKV